jgi:DNA invertase Pin-like site-specific DNA recombinase
MEEKINAVYIMVRQDELKPEDGGSYERPLAAQEKECLEFLKARVGEEDNTRIQVYRRRSDLLKDMDRHLVKRLVVEDMDRLGASREEIEGMLFELNMEGVEVLSLASRK